MELTIDELDQLPPNRETARDRTLVENDSEIPFWKTASHQIRPLSTDTEIADILLMILFVPDRFLLRRVG